MIPLGTFLLGRILREVTMGIMVTIVVVMAQALLIVLIIVDN